MNDGNALGPKQLLKAISNTREVDIDPEAEEPIVVKSGTIPREKLDVAERYMVRKSDIDKLFKYIKTLKKQIASLQKKIRTGH